MKLSDLARAILCLSTITSAGPILETRQVYKSQSFSPLEKRQQFDQGEPIDATGKGGPFSGPPLLQTSG